MATEKCLQEMRTITNSFKVMVPDKNVLINKCIMLHPDVSDDDLVMFISRACKTKAENVKQNSVVLMNDKCICFMQDDKYYLLPAKVISMAMFSDDDTLVLCDYGEKPINRDDFVEL